MTLENRAQGCLLGLACGDALGRPVEFTTAEEIASRHGEVTEMLGYGTHDQPPGTITDDTELALCIAESLVDRGGFDPEDVAQRFVVWYESGPFDIGLMTRDALSRIRQGTPWHEAGANVWKSRPEGSNAGNGSVMRCAPHAIAFREFPMELTQVSRLSSAITHADPRCQWGCVILNKTLANLLRDVDDPLGTALEATVPAPEELTSALTAVSEAVTGARDPDAFESTLETSGYVVDSLQTGLYYGLSADSADAAISRAVNQGGDTDTIGAIAGAVAGARFGVTELPDRWVEQINEADRLERVARDLLTIRERAMETDAQSDDSDRVIFKGRTIHGPAYISVTEREEATIGHRPPPAPHRTIDSRYHELTPETAAMVDWEWRAWALEHDPESDYTGPQPEVGVCSEEPSHPLLPFPQYPFADSFDDLPAQDQRRITRDGRAVADAFCRALTEFEKLRDQLSESDPEAVNRARIVPLRGATRKLRQRFDDAERVLTRPVPEDDDQNRERNAVVDPVNSGDIIIEQPQRIDELAEELHGISDDAAAALDYVTQAYPPEHYGESDDPDASALIGNLRDAARTMVGELHVLYESLRRIAIRHPGVDHEPWQADAEPAHHQT